MIVTISVGYDLFGKSVVGEDVGGVYLGDSGGVDLLVAGYEDGGFGTVVIRDHEDGVVSIRNW